MKKILFLTSIVSLAVLSCKKDDSTTVYKEPSDIATQNSYDDQGIQKYMAEHYLDTSGNVRAFSSTDPADDNYKKLSEMNPVTLNSGVVYIQREGAQPNPGTAIGSTDILHFMSQSVGYLAVPTDGVVSLTSGATFTNTVSTTGTPEIDPMYYYVKQSVMDASSQGRSYYEIEGLKEGLSYFKAFNKDDSENYNMQGVILIPSRAAFARDSHYNYLNLNWRNRVFVFNFQVYKSIPR